MDWLIASFLTHCNSQQSVQHLALTPSVCLSAYVFSYRKIVFSSFVSLLCFEDPSKARLSHHITSQYITFSGQGLDQGQGQVPTIYQNHFQCRNLDCKNYGNDHPFTVKRAATVKMPVRKYDTPDGSVVRERTVLYRTTALCCVFDDDTVQ